VGPFRGWGPKKKGLPKLTEEKRTSEAGGPLRLQKMSKRSDHGDEAAIEKRRQHLGGATFFNGERERSQFFRYPHPRMKKKESYLHRRKAVAFLPIKQITASGRQKEKGMLSHKGKEKFGPRAPILSTGL